MYEAKYSRYVTGNRNRFAEESEILQGLTPIQEGSGVPLYAKDGQIYVDDSDTNTMTIGPTGCGKTRSVNKVLLASILNRDQSVIVNDPKGELYAATADLAYERGYDVKVLNLRYPDRSDCWNPLALIYHFFTSGEIAKANQAIDEFATSLMSVAANQNDRYWDLEAAHFLAAIIKLFLLIVPSKEYFTLDNILPFASRDAEHDLKEIIHYYRDLPVPVLNSIKSVVNLEAEKTKSCIYSVVSTGIGHLVKNESLLGLFSGSGDNIDLLEIGRKPTAVYVIYPDEQISLDNIVNSFLTQSYVALNWVCAEYPDNRLPICVHYDLDEFSNLCAIEKFENRISECRSKNIRFHLFIQSMNQLSQKYSEPIAKTILSNCSSWIAFSSKESSFLHTLSDICGKVVDFRGVERPLISASDMQYLRKGEDGVQVLVLRQGVHPYVTELPHYDKSVIYREAGKRSILDIKARKEVSNKYYLTTDRWSQAVYESYVRCKESRNRITQAEALKDVFTPVKYIRDVI